MWCLFFAVQVLANMTVASIDNQGQHFETWEPLLWESSSAVVMACMVPLMLMFDKRYPIQFSSLKTHLLAHLLFTVPFSIVHVLAMVGIRKVVYWYSGGYYDFGHWPTQLFYEYLKDFRSYFSLLALVYLYRFILFRLQGEASLLDASETTPANEQTSIQPEHLLVKKLGKEFLIRVQEIEWLEACGNYVNLHLAGRAYPYRGTMKSLESKLDSSQFLRVHRSYMVNYGHIASIEPLESGDAKIQLRQNQELPFSRRYRAELKEVL